ncbi:hypothetical protein QWJ34_10710 [Saccharibacillus sp. CPCC 101409]|uniref:hypothetical protein n=1 Tax=Saccharibacillus sp. CPCC 101409 TaxID=3058041 RepID=UPI00267367E4|nr:hypothetical protein [Saccharibacillus sp. CPCC 101409]MDO3410231.1 hypothetical protein [Saccharibacillus sp. CPCC 101409]
MNMSIHNLMAFNPHHFRAQPAVSPEKNADGEKSKSFREILNEKMEASAAIR